MENEQPTLLTKEEFMNWLTYNFKVWAGSGPRTQESWLYSLQDFAREMNRGK